MAKWYRTESHHFYGNNAVAAYAFWSSRNYMGYMPDVGFWRGTRRSDGFATYSASEVFNLGGIAAGSVGDKVTMSLSKYDFTDPLMRFFPAGTIQYTIKRNTTYPTKVWIYIGSSADQVIGLRQKKAVYGANTKKAYRYIAAWRYGTCEVNYDQAAATWKLTTNSVIMISTTGELQSQYTLTGAPRVGSTIQANEGTVFRYL